MALTERLIKGTQDVNRQKAREYERQLDPEEDETGMAYAPRKTNQFINEEKGVFTTEMTSGINTEKSVFDKTAIFRVGNAEDSV